jgi:hypothetical protein
LLLAIFIDFLFDQKKRGVRITAYVSVTAITLLTLLYTCVCISPFWQKDPRVACANWIIENIPKGSGVTWAPRHQPFNWSVPGTRIAPYLFKEFPRQAEPGKEQYLLVSPRVKGIFKKHPPSRKIIPKEWFPTQPPTKQEILLFYEINQGGGKNVELVKSFSSYPSFCGITLKAFGESPTTSTTFACKNVQLFKLKRVR